MDLTQVRSEGMRSYGKISASLAIKHRWRLQSCDRMAAKFSIDAVTVLQRLWAVSIDRDLKCVTKSHGNSKRTRRVLRQFMKSSRA